MEKLKKIINQLNSDHFSNFEKNLQAHNSAKFLLLFKAYKELALTDDEIKTRLNCNDNALYVLKSRLYDKIQKFLVDVESPEKTETHSHENLAHYLYEYPRETGIAMLNEIESNYLKDDLSDDLINVYSALKKAHYFSDKYYTYSQLYNKQVAYTIALEKAEDILFNFNKTLSNYFFSSSETDLDLIVILKNEIKNIYSLNKSPRVELILNIILVQTALFTTINLNDEEPIEDLLEKCESIFDSYKEDKRIGHTKWVITFLKFEYYNKINQLKKSMIYFESLNQYSQKWLLLSNHCMVFKFLLSKIDILLHSEKKDEIGIGADDMLMDPNDLYTNVIYKFYKSISNYFSGNIKLSISILNDLLNEVSFKNYFYIEIEIKLSLAYFYIKQKEYDLAENLLNSISRKISGLKTEGYRNVKEAIKIFTLMINSEGTTPKIKKAIDQFKFYNFSERKILSHFETEIEKLLRD